MGIVKGRKKRKRVTHTKEEQIERELERIIEQSTVYDKGRLRPKTRANKIMGLRQEYAEYAKYEKRVKFRALAHKFIAFREGLNNLRLQEEE